MFELIHVHRYRHIKWFGLAYTLMLANRVSVNQAHVSSGHVSYCPSQYFEGCIGEQWILLFIDPNDEIDTRCNTLGNSSQAMYTLQYSRKLVDSVISCSSPWEIMITKFFRPCLGIILPEYKVVCIEIA